MPLTCRLPFSASPLRLNPQPQTRAHIRYAATDDPRHPTGLFIAYRHLLEDLGEGARGSPGGCLAIGHRESGGRDPRFKGGDGGGGWDDEDGYGGGSSSVGGDSCCSTSVAASRVFGKPTGLSRVSGGGWGGVAGAKGGRRKDASDSGEGVVLVLYMHSRRTCFAVAVVG